MSIPPKFASSAAVSAEVQLAFSSAERTQQVRTDQARTSAGVDPFADGSSVQYARTNAPGIAGCRPLVRTERASGSDHDPAHPIGPRGWARKAVAEQLKVGLERRMANEEAWASNRALGPKCGVDEAVVRKWRSGEKTIPLCALLVLPPSIANDLVAFVLDKRGLANRRGLPMLREAVLKLEADVSEDDRDATIDALDDVITQLTARKARLKAVGR